MPGQQPAPAPPPTYASHRRRARPGMPAKLRGLLLVLDARLRGVPVGVAAFLQRSVAGGAVVPQHLAERGRPANGGPHEALVRTHHPVHPLRLLWATWPRPLTSPPQTEDPCALDTSERPRDAFPAPAEAGETLAREDGLSCEDGVEGVGELRISVPDQELHLVNAVVQRHEGVTSLLAAQLPVGWPHRGRRFEKETGRWSWGWLRCPR